MPKDLPRPLNSTVAGDSAGRCRLSKEDLQPRRFSNEYEGQALLQSSSSELTDALYDSGSVFLPCPSFTGPFSYTTALKRISTGLKPFVRLPLHPESDLETSAEPVEGRRRRASSTPQPESETQPYTYTSFDDLAPVSPAPWPSVQPMRIVPIRPERSSTILTMNSESSTGTHHMTMMDIYLTGKLATQYGSPLSQPDNKISKKKKRSRQSRRSTLRHPIPNTRAPYRLSTASTKSNDSFASAKTHQSSTSTSSRRSFCDVRTSISRTDSSTSLADARAQGTFSSPVTLQAVEARLQATLLRFPPPSPVNYTPPVSPATWQKSLFMSPHEYDHDFERRDTATTIDTVNSVLTDSLAVSYRQSRTISRRFVDGYWEWESHPLDVQPPVIPEARTTNAGDEAQRSWLSVILKWALLRWR